MRRITIGIVSTISAVVLLFSYRTSITATAAGALATGANRPGIVSSPAPAGPPPAGSGDPGTAPPSAPATSAAPRPAGSLVVNGTVVDTRYGPVQVQAHISNSKITDVVPLRLTSGDRRDEEINSYAVPQLRQEVLQAQSANVDVVSGATYTSEAYLRSLQAALDTAHFH
ncbi:FMN-binding protein [Planosporangium thailandense]|uniref:FMN-binding protein n=1 Tax=Planosporangium thailandense TaxID=765197 RepID=A0ABX0XRE2_9ACTN|nr:FMN-binding protein [Planosporangium thailandense]